MQGTCECAKQALTSLSSMVSVCVAALPTHEEALLMRTLGRSAAPAAASRGKRASFNIPSTPPHPTTSSLTPHSLSLCSSDWMLKCSASMRVRLGQRSRTVPSIPSSNSNTTSSVRPGNGLKAEREQDVGQKPPSILTCVVAGVWWVTTKCGHMRQHVNHTKQKCSFTLRLLREAG